MVLILAGALLLGLMLLGVLWWRFRELFESVSASRLGLALAAVFVPQPPFLAAQILKRFLMLDILLIFMIGGGILVLLFAAEVGLAIEVASFMVLLWNFGMGGLASLYLWVPPSVHRFYLGILNVIMVRLASCCVCPGSELDCDAVLAVCRP